MKNKELAELMKYVLQDKEKHFEKLFHEIADTVYYMALKILKNTTEAEDAAQDAIVYIYDHLEDVKSPNAFNRWMNRVVFGICHRYIERGVANKNISLDESYLEVSVAEEDHPEEIVERKSKAEIMLSLVDE